jgi:hypothetical protein
MAPPCTPQVSFLNLPYFAAAQTVGGEANLLKMGSREGEGRSARSP